MIDSQLLDILASCGMSEWAVALEKINLKDRSNFRHGFYPKWQSELSRLPNLLPSSICLDQPCISVGLPFDTTDADSRRLLQVLESLKPWRKGPFNFFGILVDSEWRSDLKWERLRPHVDLKGQVVLDIGCNNAYYSLRMLGAGAKYVIGIDPTILFYMQFLAIKQYLSAYHVSMLPISASELPDHLNFNSVFSMGVLYHQRNPLLHLSQLHNFLCSGGLLILETLIVETDLYDFLQPLDRYAKMRNVYMIPTPSTLLGWVEQAGFIKARIVDITITSGYEQRQTRWMCGQSLQDFLDKTDKTKTIEGYPAPKRAILLADKV